MYCSVARVFVILFSDLSFPGHNRVRRGNKRQYSAYHLYVNKHNICHAQVYTARSVLMATWSRRRRALCALGKLGADG